MPDLPGVSISAVLSVEDGALTWRLTDVVDPDAAVHRISVPRLDLASADGTRAGAQVVTADLSVDRAETADATWIGIEELGGWHQANLTLDDLRLEDPGPADRRKAPRPAPERLVWPRPLTPL